MKKVISNAAVQSMINSDAALMLEVGKIENSMPGDDSIEIHAYAYSCLIKELLACRMLIKELKTQGILNTFGEIRH
jgi:hypothetical protein